MSKLSIRYSLCLSDNYACLAIVVILHTCVLGHRSLFDIHCQLFRGGSGPIRRRYQSYRRSTPYGPPAWSHKFYCLSNKHCTSLPQSKQQREVLTASGLGEKLITVGLHSSVEELHQVILNTFPKLSTCRRYELLRCQGVSRDLSH